MTSRGRNTSVQSTLGSSEKTKHVPASCNAIVQLTDLAETCSMRELLAHCELLMIKDKASDLWTDPAMLSNAVSRHSLLRMLRACQAGLGTSNYGNQLVGYYGNQLVGYYADSQQTPSQKSLSDAQDAAVSTLMS